MTNWREYKKAHNLHTWTPANGECYLDAREMADAEAACRGKCTFVGEAESLGGYWFDVWQEEKSGHYFTTDDYNDFIWDFTLERLFDRIAKFTTISADGRVCMAE